MRLIYQKHNLSAFFRQCFRSGEIKISPFKRALSLNSFTTALFVFTLISFSVFTPSTAFAEPLYAPGETLDPACSPADPDCTVTAPATAGANSDITSLSNLTMATTTALAVTGQASANTLIISGQVTAGSLEVAGLTALNNLEVSGLTTLGTASITDLSVTGLTLGGVYRNSWPVESGTGGSWWATSSDSLVGFPDLAGHYAVVIGANATSSNSSKFEVVGNSIFSGNVGIGSTNPAYTLEINPQNNILAAIGLKSTGGAGNAILLGSNNAYGGGISYGMKTANALEFYSSTAPGNGNVPQLTLLQNGNVGVGSSTPLSTLSVSGIAGTNPFTIASSTGNAMLTLSQSGFLGIGKANPTVALDVQGDDNNVLNLTSSRDYNSATTNNYSRYIIFSSTDPDGAGTWGEIRGVQEVNHSKPRLSLTFSTADYPGQPLYERMRITRSGNVGIGTTSPFAKLSVAGDAFIGGNLTATGSTQLASLTTSGTAQLAYASTTALTVSGSTYLSSLTGPLQAVNGLVSATSTLSAVYGGTGNSSYSIGDILYANSATTLGRLSDVAVGNVLLAGGANSAPYWGKINLATNIASIAQGWLSSDGTTITSSTSPTVAYLTATSTTATSTFAGGLKVGNNSGLVVEAGALANSLYVKTNGNVGIGTVSPKQKLEVNGNLNLSLSLGTANADTFISQLSFSNAYAADGSAPGTKIAAYTGSTAFTSNLRFYTSNGAGVNEALRITETGNLGVGTTNPSAKLSVTLDAVEKLTKTAFQIDDGFYRYRFGWGGTMTGLSFYGNSSAWYIDDRIGGVGYPIYIARNGIPIIAIPGGSTNVGIGTTTPSAKLDVWGNLQVGTSSTPALFVNTSNGKVGIGITTPNTDLDVNGVIQARSMVRSLSYRNYGANDISIFNEGTNKSITFTTSPDGSNFYERLRIDGSGNVGIGIASPTTPLEIRKTDALGGSISNVGAYYHDGTTPAIGIGSRFILGAIMNGGRRDGAYIDTQFTNVGAGTEAANLSFSTRSSGALTSQMTITGAGNIGIGTSSPLTKLSVQGTAGSAGVLNIASSTGASMLYVAASGKVGIGTADLSVNSVLRVHTEDVVNQYGIYISKPSGMSGNLLYASEATGSYYSLGSNGIFKMGYGDSFTMKATGLGGSVRDAITVNIDSTLSYPHLGLQTTGGNVGIGTSSPQTKLYIESTGSDTDFLTLYGNRTSSNSEVGIAFRDRNPFGTQGQLAGRINTLRDGSNGQFNMVFSTAPNGTTDATEKMRITYGGNVGIGTTNPLQTLDMKAGGTYGYNGAILAQASTTLNNFFFGGAGNLAMTGNENSGFGYLALNSNTTGTLTLRLVAIP